MTILNRASDGHYNVLIVLFRVLIAEGKVDQTKLIEWCSDLSENADKHVGNTLNKWLQLGLFERNGDLISLDSSVKKIIDREKDIDVVTLKLPSILRGIIFSDEHNKRFWDQEKSLTADFTRGLTWLLAQNIYTFDLSSHPKVEAEEAKQIIDPKLCMFKNDTRWNGVRAWATYLGFFWISRQNIIDPTIALREELPQIFGSKKELSSDDFVSSIASVIPVLDGGKYRQELESKLDEAAWGKPERKDLLSTSLSRAIWRLENDKKIKLESLADPESIRFLQRAGGAEIRSFSHVRLLGGAR